MYDIEALKLKFNEIEQDKRFKKGAGYKFYLHLKAFLYGVEENYEAKLECLFERARLFNNINSMASTYAYLEGGSEKTLEIFEILEIVLEKDYTLISHDERMCRQYFTNKRNLCYDYKKLGRYQDCVNTANKAISRYGGNNHTSHISTCFIKKRLVL